MDLSGLSKFLLHVGLSAANARNEEISSFLHRKQIIVCFLVPHLAPGWF